MAVKQYVYFALYSRDIPAAEMAAALGIEPDETTIRGSRRTEPRPIPPRHCWKVVCREPGLRVDDQVARVLERLAPRADAIAALARRLGDEDPGSGAVLQIVRYFNDDPGQQAPLAGHNSQPDAPKLVGWHLDRETLNFLHATQADLDVDEYDMTPDYADDLPARPGPEQRNRQSARHSRGVGIDRWRPGRSG